MHEIELKFQIPAERLSAVRAELARLGADLSQPLILQAAYFDTADRKLAQARSALRVRREGDEWVQTLKAAGSHTMVRVEDNQPAREPASGEAIRPELGRHGAAARQALVQSLSWQPDADPIGEHCGLLQLYRTDMRRTRARWQVAPGTPHEGVVELALDEGEILAGALREPVRELEIELLSGHPQAVIEAGRAWVHRFGLWLDTQTKAHRGDRLARLAANVPPGEHHGDARALASPQATLARPARVPAGASADEAERAGLEACLAHLSANMSELASLPSGQGAEVAWEWRRGLRRLKAFADLMHQRRMAHHLAADAPAPSSRWTLEAAGLARALVRDLGHWRDDEALSWVPRQLEADGGPRVPLPPAPEPRAAELPASAADLARGREATELCLCLLTALVHPPSAEPGSPWRPLLHAHLRHQTRALRRRIRQHQRLEDEEAHRLRRRLRQVRDVIGLFAADDVPRSCSQALDAAISALGQLHDEAVARTRYEAMASSDPRAQLATGWLLGRRPASVALARRALRKWSKCASPW